MDPFFIMIMLSTCVSLPEEYRKASEKNIQLGNKKVFVITITHLSDSKDITTLNTSILTAVGTSKVLPTIPDALKVSVENFIMQTIQAQVTSLPGGILEAASKIADFDTLLLVKTEDVMIVTSILGIEILKSPGIKMYGVLYDVPSKKVLAIVQTRSTIKEEMRQPSLVSAGQNFVAKIISD